MYVQTHGGACSKSNQTMTASWAHPKSGKFASWHMEGILLAPTAVTFVTGSSLNCRVLSCLDSFILEAMQ
jgi:hypothetical protein